VPAPLLCANTDVERANTPSRRSELRIFTESPNGCWHALKRCKPHASTHRPQF
jgi:hypothetical protein